MLREVSYQISDSYNWQGSIIITHQTLLGLFLVSLQRIEVPQIHQKQNKVGIRRLLKWVYDYLFGQRLRLILCSKQNSYFLQIISPLIQSYQSFFINEFYKTFERSLILGSLDNTFNSSVFLFIKLLLRICQRNYQKKQIVDEFKKLENQHIQGNTLKLKLQVNSCEKLRRNVPNFKMIPRLPEYLIFEV
ncbi:unnamed protein product [Paramecium sonneborni]|uniref:Uncharacterized protein n=1 Tax=Paramecium sonneborni TaxID=65129 RepID=A0A8S1QWH3_9CILI|nr:unnamed protein product [Paramecium sonneborni]